jgi:HEAT repeat protein
LLNDPDRRIEALDALGATRDPRAAPALIRSLTSFRADVRAAAARALGTVRDPAAHAPLAALAATDKNSTVALCTDGRAPEKGPARRTSVDAEFGEPLSSVSAHTQFV